MEQNTLYAAMDQLRSQYLTLDWTYHDITFGTQAEKMYRWPGPEDEEILVFGGTRATVNRSCFTGMIFSISIILTRVNTTPSVLNMTIGSPSAKASFMLGSLLPATLSAYTMIGKQQSSAS